MYTLYTRTHKEKQREMLRCAYMARAMLSSLSCGSMYDRCMESSASHTQ